MIAWALPAQAKDRPIKIPVSGSNTEFAASLIVTVTAQDTIAAAAKWPRIHRLTSLLYPGRSPLPLKNHRQYVGMFIAPPDLFCEYCDI